MKIRLTIDVTYDTNDTCTSALIDLLEDAATHLAENGLFTGERAATVETWNSSTQVIMQDSTSRHSDEEHKADEENLGTPEYKGIAWFWHHHYRHSLRDCGPQRRIQVHHALIHAGLVLDDTSEKHHEIIEEISRRTTPPSPESRIIIAHVG